MKLLLKCYSNLSNGWITILIEDHRVGKYNNICSLETTYLCKSVVILAICVTGLILDFSGS